MTTKEMINKQNLSLIAVKFICAIAILSFTSASYAIPIDTVKINNDEIEILLGDDQIVVRKKNFPPKKYYGDLLFSQNDSVKLAIDSCLWRKYYNGEIKEGHSRFLCFLLFNKKGKVDDVYFSEPLSASGEEFYLQVTSAIKKYVEESSFCRKRKLLRRDRKKSFFYFFYKINLYP